MFGFGMTLSSCCASGVMVEMVSDVPRALVTLLMFGLGVFIGLPIQASSSLVTETLLSTSSFEGWGVYLPNLFSKGPLDGYLMFVIAIIFGIMMATTSAGWGASPPFGLWFGKLLIAMGVDSQFIAVFTHRPEKLFTMPFFEHGVSVQNFGILLGTLVAVLWLGKWASPFK